MRLSKTHRAMVAALMDAKDDDLPSLLKLSGLDPKTELVGADFRGMDYSGIDLADYNLSRCNLSGADLRKAVNVDRAMFADVIDTGTLWPTRLRSRPGSEAARTLAIEPAMIAIAPGRFIMGAADAELKRETVPTHYRSREQPCVEVAVDRPFLLGRYPVTVGEFRRFVQETGYPIPRGAYGWVKGKGWEQRDEFFWDNPGFEQTDRHPVTCVLPADAEAYARWLNDKADKGYRLPSEVEFEYACRAGTTTARFWGNDRAGARRFANVSDLSLARELKEKPDPERFFRHDDGFAFTAPVGSFAPNPWGLYDMLGNVWEWMADDWHDSLSDPVPSQNPRIKSEKTLLRAVRGGSWSSDPWLVRSAARVWSDDRLTDIGFRLARTSLAS